MVEEKETSQVIEYVLGFLFTSVYEYPDVVLVEKKRPSWQAGQLNGVGGHIESEETPQQAMDREFVEETGVSGVDWKMFGKMGNEEWSCFLFCASDNIKACEVSTAGDEEVDRYAVGELPSLYTVGNLHWLVLIAQDALSHSGPLFTEISYPESEVDKRLL